MWPPRCVNTGWQTPATVEETGSMSAAGAGRDKAGGGDGITNRSSKTRPRWLAAAAAKAC